MTLFNDITISQLRKQIAILENDLINDNILDETLCLDDVITLQKAVSILEDTNELI